MSKAELLYQKLEANEFKCALSGWDLSIDGFELDHIISVEDGGTDKVSNLQCVHPLVNKAKGTMGNQQFIDMCRAVAKVNS